MFKKSIAAFLSLLLILEVMMVNIPLNTYAVTAGGNPDIAYWQTFIDHEAQCQFMLDSSIKHSGNLALKLTDATPAAPFTYGMIYQDVAVKPNTKYRVSMWLKAENIMDVHVSVLTNGDRYILDNGTYDWKLIEVERTTAESQTTMNLGFILNNTTGGLWVDDISVKEIGSDGSVIGDNVVQNGDFEIQPIVENVTANPPQGTVASGTQVTLSTATQGADIYYTLDGTDPVTSGTVVKYIAPITIDKNTTIKAYAKMDGMADSGVSNFQYVVAKSIPFWQTFIDHNAQCQFALDSYTKHAGNQSLKITDSTPAAPFTYGMIYQDVAVKPNTKYRLSMWVKAENIMDVHVSVLTNGDRYILDNGTYDWKLIEVDRTTAESQTTMNLGFILNNTTGGLWVDDISVKEIGNDGSVIGENIVKNGDFEAQLNVENVTANPPQGTVAPGTEVTLTTATQGADIYYTLDGTDPVVSGTATRYTTPIAINKDTTIKAYAKMEGMTDSSISSFTYAMKTWVEGNSLFDLDQYMTNIGSQTTMPVIKTSAINIDGKLDDWSGNAKIMLPTDIARQVKIGNWSGLADLSADAGFAYDDKNLYVAIKVKDNVHKAYEGDSMWSGDSIQFACSKDGISYGPEYGFADVNGSPSVWCWNKGSAALAKDSINLKTSQSGDETTYEAAIPWQAILPDNPGENLKFTFMINDNDGEGRKGWIEWTPGIGTTKDVPSFGTLRFVKEGQNWVSWMSGPKQVQTGEIAEFTLCIPNYSAESINLKLSIPSAGIDNEDIQIPAKTVLQKGFSITFPDVGDKTVTANISETATGKVVNETCKVNVIKDPVSLKNQFDTLSSELSVLEGLLQQCKDRDIPTDYEMVNYTTIKDFIKYGIDDINHNCLTKAAYVADELEKLYTEAVDNLNAYLNGSKTPTAVPRYITGPTAINKYSFLGDTKTGNSDSTEKRPIFFTGFGHFYQVKADVPKLKDYGTNIIQIETGPCQVVINPEDIDGWGKVINGGAQVSFSLDKTVFYNGQSSLKIINQSPVSPNVYGMLSQEIPVKPNTTYEISAWVKGNNVGTASFNADWGERHYINKGTYDWTKMNFEITTAADQKLLDLRFICEDITDGLWIDDLSMSEKESTDNILINGGFEEKSSIIGDYRVSTAIFEGDTLKTLQNAEKNNIAVNLLLSPHYFPEWALQKWPELKINSSDFIKFSITAPRSKEIMELYLETVAALVKGKSLQSITLSNEPKYDSRMDAYAQAPWKEYLKNKYKNINSLNDVYGTSYSTFEQVPMPSGNGPSVQYYEWVKFNNQLLSGWHKWMADVVHQIAPDIPVQVKTMAFVNGAVDYGVDPEEFAEFSQINGNDNWNYLGQGPIGFLKKTLFYDLQCSLKKAPVFNSEDHIINDGDNRYVPEQAIHVGADLWQGAVHGKTASTIWVWERTYDEQSGLAGSIMNRPDVVSKVGKTNLDLNRLAYEVTALQNIKPKAAILYSTASMAYSEQAYLDSLYKAYEALSYSGQKVGFVSDKQITENALGDYKLLIVPESTNISAATLTGIKKFIAEGGKVLINGNNLWKDENNKELPEADRTYVISNSQVVASTATAKELRNILLDTLNILGLNKVMLMDKSTNEPVYGVEWLSTEYNGKILLNIMNYEQIAKNIYIKVNGKTVTQWDELISGNKATSDELKLDWLGRNLLSFEAEKTQEQKPASTTTEVTTSTTVEAGSLKIQAKQDADGMANVEIKADDLQKAIDTAKDNTVSIKVKAAIDAKAVKVNIPMQKINVAKQKEIERIEVEMGLAKISLSPDVLGNMGEASANVELSVSNVGAAALSDEIKQKIGNNTVYNFNLSVAGNKVSTFGKNDITVEVPYTLKDGEDPYKAVVYYINDKGGLEVVKECSYNAATGTIAFSPRHFSRYVAGYSDITFKDISNVSWAKSSIEALAARGIISGNGNNLFKPDDKITRAEYIKMLMNAFDFEDSDAKCSFSDVKEDSPYYSAIATAQKLGIVNGKGNGNFGVNDRITRQDMAVMTYKMVQLLKAKVNSKETGIQFTDKSDISSYALAAVISMQSAGIMNGVGNGNFAPREQTTRAQAAVIIYKLFNIVNQI